MNRPLRRYLAYGLQVNSQIALPFAAPAEPPAGEPDVTIRVGAAPAALANPTASRGNIWQARPGAFLLNIDGVGRFLVADGREILVEPRGGSDWQLGHFLAGSTFAALLQQRAVVTLHAGAVETAAGAVLFAGRAGIGKSSLLAALVERGYAMLSDGFTGVVPGGDGRFRALSGFPTLRLWADALDELGWRSQAQTRVREGLEKYLLPAARFRVEPLAIRAVYLLTEHSNSTVAIDPLPCAAAFWWLSKYTYRKHFLKGTGQGLAHFHAVAAMAQHLPVLQVRRPTHPFLLNALADRVEEDLREPATLPLAKAAALEAPSSAAAAG